MIYVLTFSLSLCGMFPTTLMMDSTFLPSTTPTGVSGSAVGSGTVLQAEGRGYDSRWDGVTKILH